MNMLWLNADLLLPLDKGGKLRTWHLMRQLARRHAHHLSVLRGSRHTAQPIAIGMRRGLLRARDRCRARDPPKGTRRFYADAARHSSTRCPMRSRKYRSAAYRRAVSERARARRGSTVSCAISSCPPSTCPSRLPCPAVLFTHNVEAEIWRRHAETAISRLRDATAPAAVARACGASRAARWRGSICVLAVSDADRDTLQRALSGRAVPAQCTSCRPVWTPTTSRPVPESSGTTRASRLHRVDGLAAERGRHAVLRPRDPAAHPAGRARRHASASSDARRRRPCSGWRRSPASRSPAAWTTSGRTSRAARSTSCRCGSAAARD